VWHLPFDFAVADVQQGRGSVSRPLHLAFPTLYARPDKPTTLGEAVHMADGGRVDAAAVGLGAQGNIGQALREMLLLFEYRDQAKRLLTAFPAAWVDAARQHQQQVAAGHAPPPDPQHVISVLLSDAHWQWVGPEAMSLPLQSVTVKTATAFYLHPVHLARAVKHKVYITSAVQSQRLTRQTLEHRHAQLMATLAAVWKWRLPNQHKEILWRLAVDGVAGAKSSISWVCGCGQHPPDMRAHYFWDCIVAHTVIDLVQDVVTSFAPDAEVRRTNIWLLHPPPGFQCHITVWRGVCLAALNAMDRGRRVISKALLSWRTSQPNAQAQPPSIALHGQWIQVACDRAVQAFWREMSTFVHYLNACDPGKGPELGADHPFVSGIGMDPDTGRAAYELAVPDAMSDVASSASLSTQ
jgi:hypothetical protein